MSNALEKIMMLKQMSQNSQPQMTEQQRDFAQGEMLMKLAAQMRNPNHGGSGLGRMLTVANASMDPIEESWKKARERSLKENNEGMDFAMKLYNMDIAEEKRKEDREYNKRYLDIQEGKNNDGLSTPIELPEGIEGVPYSRLTKQERHSATKRMQDELDSAISQGNTFKVAKEIDNLLDEYPDLSEHVYLAMTNPNKAHTVTETLKRNIMTEDQQEKYNAMVEFEKLTSDLALKQASASGGRSTDQLRQMILSAKPKFSNPYKANKAVLGHIMEENAEGLEYEKALRYGINNQVRITRDPRKYREKSGFKRQNVRGEKKEDKKPGNQQQDESRVSEHDQISMESANEPAIYKVRNSTTGEEMMVTKSQARQMGVIK